MKTRDFLCAAACALVFAACAVGTADAQVYNYGAYVVRDHDRVVLRDFIVNERARRCHENETRRIEPCGLASRIVVSYAPGSVLPLEVADEMVPRHVTRHLAPPPHGAAYVYAGDNVYLIDVLSRHILDTVPLATD
jgi:hypothetical protein